MKRVSLSVDGGHSIIHRRSTQAVSVGFDLACDTCNFSRTVDEEISAYLSAKDHEEAHPTHFVFIRTTE